MLHLQLLLQICNGPLEFALGNLMLWCLSIGGQLQACLQAFDGSFERFFPQSMNVPNPQQFQPRNFASIQCLLRRSTGFGHFGLKYSLPINRRGTGHCMSQLPKLAFQAGLLRLQNSVFRLISPILIEGLVQASLKLSD
mmetsp:Transcript_7797/g.22337  ORF Transcript_7797/g.22337 Transcript_7797/m.22337 type:complete len:139 (+) Transcript_7797:1102-1518(+)